MSDQILSVEAESVDAESLRVDACPVDAESLRVDVFPVDAESLRVAETAETFAVRRDEGVASTVRVPAQELETDTITVKTVARAAYAYCERAARRLASRALTVTDHTWTRRPAASLRRFSARRDATRASRPRGRAILLASRILNV